MILDIGGYNGGEGWKELGSKALPAVYGSLKIGGVVLLLCWTLLLSAVATVLLALRRLMRTNSLQLAFTSLLKNSAKVVAVHVALLLAAVLLIVSDIPAWYIVGGAVLLALLLGIVLRKTLVYFLAFRFRKYLQWFAILRKGKDVYTEINQHRR